MLGADTNLGTTAIVVALVASVGLVLLNGIYVAYEFALIAAKRSSFEDDSGPRQRTNRAARAGLTDINMHLAGTQLGITMASLALGRIGEPALESVFLRLLGQSVSPAVATAIGFTAALTIFSFLHLIFGEMVPKNIALVAPDATLRWLVIPYRVYMVVFRPIIGSLNGLANVGCRLVGVEPKDELLAVHTVPELATIVARSKQGGAIEADDAELLQGVLDFSRRPVADVATPIGNLGTVALGATAAQVERVVTSTGQARIPVVDSTYGGSGEPTLIGYFHARDLLAVDPSRRAAPMPPHHVRKMAVVRDDRPLVDVLRLLRRVKRQLAVVEHDDVPVAVVSLEQVVEALARPTDSAATGEVSTTEREPSTKFRDSSRLS